MIQGTGAGATEGGPREGDRLGPCPEFNVEQLMQLLRCVAAVACAAVAVAVAWRADNKAAAGGMEIVAVLENFV